MPKNFLLFEFFYTPHSCHYEVLLASVWTRAKAYRTLIFVPLTFALAHHLCLPGCLLNWYIYIDSHRAIHKAVTYYLHRKSRFKGVYTSDFSVPFLKAPVKLNSEIYILIWTADQVEPSNRIFCGGRCGVLLSGRSPLRFVAIFVCSIIHWTEN